MASTEITCPSCGATFSVAVYNSINLKETPSMRESLVSGNVFVAECPSCGAKRLLKYPMAVLDPDAGLILCLSSRPLNAEELPEGYTIGRQVGEAGELIEKLKIFDAGLDDVAMELCKYVTLQELGKDVSLKFLRLDGADNEVIFTYPENGKMEMLSVGFNVYEDCCGIVSRNPDLCGGKGLVKVDQGWISSFMAEA